MCLSLPLYFIPNATSDLNSHQGESYNSSQQSLLLNDSFLEYQDTIKSNTSYSAAPYSGMRLQCGGSGTNPTRSSQRAALCLLQELIRDRSVLSQEEIDTLCTHLEPMNLTLISNECVINVPVENDPKNCDHILKGSQNINNENISPKIISCQQSPTSDVHYISWCLECSNTSLNSTKGVQKVVGQKFSSTFWAYFWVYFVCVWIKHPVYAMINAVVYSSHGEERRNQWGKQRLWGKYSKGMWR